MAEFRMPSLGADMEAGTLIEWKVKPGDVVHRGDIVAEVVTEKGDIEIESWMSGTVDQLVVQPGQKVPVKSVLAIIKTDEQAAPKEIAKAPPAPQKEIAAAPLAAPPPAAPPARPPAGPVGEQRIRISPAARKRIEAAGIDASTIHGTGLGGAITISDVEQFLTAASKPVAVAAPTIAAAPVPPVEVQPKAPAAAPTVTAPAEAAPPAAEAKAAMRNAIARAMARSKREIPHYYLAQTIDMSRTLAWLERENLNRDVAHRLLYAAPLLKAVALAVRQVPEMNGIFQDDHWIAGDAVHVGVATSLRSGGLIAPAIHDVAAKSLDDVMAALIDLVNRVRSGGLRSSELSDPTITVTNLGERGCATVFPVIYPPQVAIVGFGSIVEEAWAENGALSARRVIHATVAGDHRVSDGHSGARFLRAIDALLQKPEQL